MVPWARAKRARLTIALASLSVLLGLAGEQVLLVLPGLSLRGDAIGLVIGAASLVGTAGIYVLALGSAGSRELFFWLASTRGARVPPIHPPSTHLAAGRSLPPNLATRRSRKRCQSRSRCSRYGIAVVV